MKLVKYLCSKCAESSILRGVAAKQDFALAKLANCLITWVYLFATSESL